MPFAYRLILVGCAMMAGGIAALYVSNEQAVIIVGTMVVAAGIVFDWER